MEVRIYGEVFGERVLISPQLEQRIQLGLSEWVIQHPAEYRTGVAYYVVFFDCKPESRHVECTMEVIGQSNVWIGHEKAKSPVNAFLRCLDDLGPICSV